MLANKKSMEMSEESTTYKILFIISLTHLLNDSIQSVIPAMFPIIERSLGLSFTQLGLISFALFFVSSVMQPLVGWYSDKRPTPAMLPIGLSITLVGVTGLAFAPSFATIILSVLLVGMGSAIFHPEASKVVFLAAGTKRGTAQSIFQVGGNSGQALAPLITALILVPLGQFGAIWFSIVAAIAVGFLWYIARWYKERLAADLLIRKNKPKMPDQPLTKAVKVALLLIVFIIFARSWYIASITNFYAFYIIEFYHFSIRLSQMYIFAFLLAGAVGTFIGGPLADRYGKKNVILVSMISAAPLSLVLPYVNAFVAFPLVALLGIILMSSFSVTVVYAQELVPGRVGMMSGVTIGLAFGMGALGAIAIGSFIDAFGLLTAMITVGFLPLLGLLSFFLPSDQSLGNKA
jgi:FSR family fosmidomycin resistance protein-like MFS transporter